MWGVGCGACGVRWGCGVWGVGCGCARRVLATFSTKQGEGLRAVLAAPTSLHYPVDFHLGNHLHLSLHHSLSLRVLVLVASVLVEVLISGGIN